jgi:hypothetical protein
VQHVCRYGHRFLSDDNQWRPHPCRSGRRACKYLKFRRKIFHADPCPGSFCNGRPGRARLGFEAASGQHAEGVRASAHRGARVNLPYFEGRVTMARMLR